MKLATLCYVRNNGNTLMLYRNKKENDVHEGKWNGLGGKVENGETPEECVIREVKEESGLDINSPKLHGFLTFPCFDGKDDWYVFVYTSDEFKGKLIDSHEGMLDWIPNEKVLELNLWEGDKFFLDWVFQGKFFSAKFIYEEGRLKDYSVTFH